MDGRTDAHKRSEALHAKAHSGQLKQVPTFVVIVRPHKRNFRSSNLTFSLNSVCIFYERMFPLYILSYPVT